MNNEEQQIYDDGYAAFFTGESDTDCPFIGIEAEYWHDGYADAEEDDAKKMSYQVKLAETSK